MIRTWGNDAEEANENFALYCKHSFIIWGCGILGGKIHKIIRSLNLDLIAFVDIDPKKQKDLFYGLPVLSPESAKELYQEKGQNVLFQLAVRKEHEQQVMLQVEEMNFSTVFSSEKISFLNDCSRVLFQEKYPEYSHFVDKCLKFEKDFTKGRMHVENPEIYDHLIVCQLPKTGDLSILETYHKACGTTLWHFHSPSLFNSEEANKREVVKCTVGVRDPIARDISSFFQIIAQFKLPYRTDAKFEAVYIFLKTSNGQPLFNLYIKEILDSLQVGEIPNHSYTTFFKNYKNNIIDVLAHPFDKEKGYTIIKEGNREVFVYQLERLSELAKPLSAFMGVPFDKIERENAAEDKWVADYYKKALKELKFPESYVDFHYNDPTVKHFYSDADLAKFRERWKNNIDPNK